VTCCSEIHYCEATEKTCPPGRNWKAVFATWDRQVSFLYKQQDRQTPVDDFIRHEVCHEEWGTDAAPLPSTVDVAVGLNVILPLYDHPTGWSLAALVGVLQRYVSDSVADIIMN